MSKKKRAIEKAKKQNSPAKKAKKAKKNYYKSYEAAEKWKDKKEKKQQRQLNQRISKGIAVECSLRSWETPSIEKCKGCDYKCSFNTNG